MRRLLNNFKNMPTQAGFRIADPNELKTLKPTDIARVGKDIYRRDLAKEQAVMPAFAKEKGAPQTAEQWAEFHKSVYAPALPASPALPANIDSSVINAGMQAGNIASQLPPATASVIKEVEVANAQNFSAGAQQTLKIYEQQMKDAQDNIKKYQDQLKQIETDRQGQVTDKYQELSQPFREKMEIAGNEEFQLKQKYEKYSSLANSLTVYADQAYNDLQAEKARPGLLSISQGKQANIKEDYYSKISLTQTAMAALQDDIALGRTFIDRGIAAVTADRQDELNSLNFINGLLNQKAEDTKTELLTATKEEKEAIQNRINTLTAEFDRIEQEKDAVRDFLLENAEIAVKAGVNLTDSLDEMTGKVTNFLNKNPQYNSENKIETVNGRKVLVSPSGNILKDLGAAYKETGAGGSGEATTPTTPETPFDADLEGAANVIMALEKAGASSSEAYWGVVKGLSEDLGLPEESIDKILVNKIKQIKGEPTGQPIIQTALEEENIASDFMATNTEQPIYKSGKTTGESLQDRAKELIQAYVDAKFTKREVIAEARKQLKEDGYPPNEVNKIIPEQGIGGIFEKLTSTWNKLFD